jgi:hypothetical protein
VAGGPLKAGFGLSGDVHMSQTSPANKTRLSSCHGDSRVFTTVDMRAGVAPETRQGILTTVTARGEFPEAAQEAPAVQGSFDFGTASLREAVPSLRMTELIANCRPARSSPVLA